MTTDWTAIESSLAAEDGDKLCEAVGHMRLNAGTNVTQSVLQECVSKLSNKDVKIRSGAVQVLNHAVQNDAAAVKYILNDLCKALTSSALTLKTGKDAWEDYVALHTNMCRMLMVLQARYPDRFIPHFKSPAAYLTTALGHECRDIANAACEYWATLMEPPVPPALMEGWVGGILPRLGKLLPNLLKAMMYHPEHVKYIEQNTQEVGGRETPVSMETFTNLRNYAALSLETMCGMFQAEAVIVLKPVILRWLGSSNWLEVEAMILALGAMTQAIGTPAELRDIYPQVFKLLLSCYSHSQPLIRSITCFTMQQFINVDPSVIRTKDPFPKMFKCTLHLISDYNCEVQEMAIQSLSALLAFAQKDITPYTRKLVEELVKADSLLKGRSRHHYYECVGHIVGRLGPGMDSKEMERLLEPLMAEWRSHSHHSNEVLREGTLMLCQSLCVVAMYAKEAFQPYNQDIFNRVLPYLQQGGSNGHGDIGGEAVTAYLVAYLDLISALVEGQGTTAAVLVADNGMVNQLLSVIQDKRYTQQVHQSVLALLGHVCNLSYSHVHVHCDTILEALSKFIQQDGDNLDIKNNAIWTLSCIATHCPDSHPKILSTVDVLSKLILSPNLEDSFQINAALALTTVYKRWPGELESKTMPEDVFLQVCVVLQKQFPRQQEKITIFNNVCHIMAADLKSVSMDTWGQFCIAAAILDCSDTALQRRVKAILKEGRAALGPHWQRIMQLTGSQVAYTLRKRYKLY